MSIIFQEMFDILNFVIMSSIDTRRVFSSGFLKFMLKHLKGFWGSFQQSFQLEQFMWSLNFVSLEWNCYLMVWSLNIYFIKMKNFLHKRSLWKINKLWRRLKIKGAATNIRPNQEKITNFSRNPHFVHYANSFNVITAQW